MLILNPSLAVDSSAVKDEEVVRNVLLSELTFKTEEEDTPRIALGSASRTFILTIEPPDRH